MFCCTFHADSSSGSQVNSLGSFPSLWKCLPADLIHYPAFFLDEIPFLRRENSPDNVSLWVCDARKIACEKLVFPFGQNLSKTVCK